jgi:polyisoprenoid-binding protein YceI
MLKAAAALFAVAFLAQDDGTTYYVGHSPKFVNITFQSDMDLEVIVGVTNKATGEIVIKKKVEDSSVSLTVPVDSMKTGIDMRDEHLRNEMWLDAKKHPTITFKSKKVKEAGPRSIEVTGDFTMHGVTKEITVTVTGKELDEAQAKAAKFPPGKWGKFTAEFDVKLSDYGVQVPEMAATKVSDTWKVKFAIYGGTAKIENK